jgi:hypothetical protein
MALTTDFQASTALVKGAYMRVERLVIPRKSADGDRLTEAVLAICESKDVEAIERRGYYFNLDMNGENPIQQAYEYMKTLPQFAGAIDC